jgi:hypothetical protein
MKPQTLLSIPRFPRIASLIAKLLTFFLSVSTLSSIIARFGGLPQHVGKAAAEWMKSPMGVYQAMYLTKDSLRIIGADSWDDTVWGSSGEAKSSDHKPVPLRLYFGEQVSERDVNAAKTG